MFCPRWRNLIPNCSPGKGRRPRPRSYRPCFHALEDRTVPSFFSPPSFPVGSSPMSQAVGDLNGDGRADLVVANEASNTVSVLLGNGDGTFQPRTDYAAGTNPLGIAVGDFNGDGKVDLVTANFGSKGVSLLLGNGDGTFQPRTDIALSTTPVSLAVADLNGDGKLDLAVVNASDGTGTVSILLQQ
jgi:DNA-binding beta-propeller fold protein YncE